MAVAIGKTEIQIKPVVLVDDPKNLGNNKGYEDVKQRLLNEHVWHPLLVIQTKKVR